MKTLHKAETSKYPANMLKDLKESTNVIGKEIEKNKKEHKGASRVEENT